MRKCSRAALAALFALGACGGVVTAQSGPSVASPAEFLAAVLPVVGSTPGDFGSYFKTAVQIHNPTPLTLTFRLVFHPSGRSGAPDDPSYTISIGPLQTRYFPDMLPAMGVASGLGSLDIFVPFGSLPAAVATVRVFNDEGAAGTSGFTEQFETVDDVIGVGQEAYLICPPEFSVYRFNIGVRTLGQGARLRITVRNTQGAVIGTVTKTYDPDFFVQTPVSAFLDGMALSGSECLAIEVTQGAAVFYGATADNRTNDPSYQPAERLID